MVTAFYMMQMTKNKKKNDFTDYYNHLFITTSNVERKCRICLQDARTPIYERDNTELITILNTVGGVNIDEDDGLPQVLCNVCYEFAKIAILFRNIAKKADSLLRGHLKVETDNMSENPQYSSDDNTSSIFTKPENEHCSSSLVKVEVKKKCIKKKITCKICRKVISRSYYKEHLKMHDPNPEKHCCEVCGKVFKLRCSYYNHKLRHRADFTFKCQLCPYRGRYLELLKNHMRTHSGDFRYMCTECPARFLYKSNLNSHMRRHKEPEFKCDTCKRGFHTKISLERHVEADHLGIKNHVCQLCGKAFGYRNGMMKHQRHVHKREKMLFGRMPSYLQAQSKQQGDN